ncbi:hypothetical protein DL95DRAFT_492342 [Leptodontidium sp. 2 PMI_412]|nr:hypothetical protein DL95DRAFT_492342 [Leptodontidium sp. 2 PMI_412]
MLLYTPGGKMDSAPIVPDSSNSPLSRISQADFITLLLNCSPASSIPLENCDKDDEDQITFPRYNNIGGYNPVKDLEPLAGSHQMDNSHKLSPTLGATTINVPRQYSREPARCAEDDTAICTQPSRHVDYLSHHWREEDIWSSWKHIVSKRGEYRNSARLENASWRAWMKSKNKLNTVSPDTLDWLKDGDITWLYGPLQIGFDKEFRIVNASRCESGRMSNSNSFLHKKSILRKRSTSETILQRPASASSVLRSAVAAAQVQQFERRSDQPLRPGTPAYVTFPSSWKRRSGEISGTSPSVSSSSTLATPGKDEKKHIRFNEQVEQCIAVGMEDTDEEGIDLDAINHDSFDSDSDHSSIMMKPKNSNGNSSAIFGKKTAKRNSFNADSKTIMMLEPTNLNPGGDGPELLERQ